MANVFYVYFHINPLKNHVFYVGIGCKRRAYSKEGRNNIWKRTVAKYGFIVDIVEEGLTWEEAQEREKHYIKRIGRRDLGKGTLVNLTDGGEGTSGFIQSDKQKEITRLRNIGNKYAAGFKNSLGIKQSQETIDKRIKKTRGRKRTETQRMNISNGKKGVKLPPFTPERSKKQSERTKGVVNTRTLVNSKGEIFSSIGIAAEFYCVKRTTLNAMLSGQNINNTDLKYHINE
jgi:GIY-YIG catalytic domain